MSGARYECVWHHSENRMELTLHGMWDDVVAGEWESVFRAAVAKAPHPGWTVLCDVSDYPPQSPSVQLTHEKLMAWAAQSGMRAFAMVAPQAVVTMQWKRMAESADAEHIGTWVTTVEEARRYLQPA